MDVQPQVSGSPASEGAPEEISRRERRRVRARRRIARGAVVAGAASVAVLSAVLVVGTTSSDGSARGAVPEPASAPLAARHAVPAVPRPIARLDLRVSPTTTTTTSPYPALPPRSGLGRRAVYCNSCQRVWLVEADGHVSMSYTVSGRRGVPHPGTYHVHRKLVSGWHKTLRLPYFVGFAFGASTDIGFHGIPLAGGRPIQSDAQLGSFRSLGCVRESQAMARLMFDWAQIGTTVVVV